MKTIILVLTTLILCSCKHEKLPVVEDSEAAIKAVVTGETYAYMEKDYQKWASYWDHSNEVLRLDVSDEGFSQTRGWDKNGAHLETFFMEHPEPITSTFENSNYLIFHDTKVAWVAFDQKWTTDSGEESLAKATITLIKKGSDWKIISYTAIRYEAEDHAADTLERE